MTYDHWKTTEPDPFEFDPGPEPEEEMSDQVICPQCKGERRVDGLLCDRCSGDAQIQRNELGPGETAPFETADYQRGWDDCYAQVLKVLGESFTTPPANGQ